MSSETDRADALNLHNRVAQRLAWLRRKEPVDMDAFLEDVEALLADLAQPADGWVAFSDAWPRESPALDDPAVKTRDRVLVTNSLNARDRMGRMSHVWIGMPQQAGDEIICFDARDCRVHGLTHWKAISAPQPPAQAEGGAS